MPTDKYPLPDSSAFPFSLLVVPGSETPLNRVFNMANSQLFYSRVPGLTSDTFVLQISGYLDINSDLDLPHIDGYTIITGMKLSISVNDEFITKKIEYRDVANLLNATVENQYSFILNSTTETLLSNILIGETYKSKLLVNMSDGNTEIVQLLDVTFRAAPEPVYQFRYIPYGDSSILLEWKDGSNNSSPINHYEFTLFNHNQKELSYCFIQDVDLIHDSTMIQGYEYNPSFNYYIMDNLVNNHVYNISLSCSNAYGSSNPVIIDNVFTTNLPMKSTITNITKNNDGIFTVSCLNNNFSPESFQIRAAFLVQTGYNGGVVSYKFIWDPNTEKFYNSDISLDSETFTFLDSNEPFTLNFTPNFPHDNSSYKYHTYLVNQHGAGEVSDPYYGYTLNSISGDFDSEPYTFTNGILNLTNLSRYTNSIDN
jgi:hypothetical protein